MKSRKFLPHLKACGSPLSAVVVLLTVVFITAPVAFAAKPAPPTGWHLGPTGFYGKLGKKDITVTYVTAGSPADGKVNVGDVILSAAGKKLDRTSASSLPPPSIQPRLLPTGHWFSN